MFTVDLQKTMWQSRPIKTKHVHRTTHAIIQCKYMYTVNGLYSVLGANYRVLCTKYGMNLNNIMKLWNERCANEEDIIRKCE